MKRIYRAERAFFTTLKINWLVRLAIEGGYQGPGSLESSPQGWSQGMKVRLKEVPFGVKLFKLVATNDDVKYFIINYLLVYLTRELVIETMKVRWQVDEFYRSFK